MGRLTLEDAIAHAKEVAEKNYRGADFESIDSIDDDIKTNCMKCAEEHEQLVKWLEELKFYKDLEEQELLLKLPIPLNTTVYTIYTKQWCYYDDNCMEDIEYKCMNGEFCENQKVRYYIHTEKFSASMINFINKTVFLNREDAEIKLKELENESVMCI